MALLPHPDDADVFVLGADGSSLAPLPPMNLVPVRTPQSDGIAPTSGDDTSAINAIASSKLNELATLAIANIGFSEGEGVRDTFPSAIDYGVTIFQAGGGDGGGVASFGMDLRLTLDFSNPRPGTSMVVNLAKIKQLVREPEKIDAQGAGADSAAAQLLLVATSFFDKVDGGGWLEIGTDVRYTATAEAVADAVMEW